MSMNFDHVDGQSMVPANALPTEPIMMENDQITFLLLCSTVQGRSERDKI
jgi:hypothetical protein